MMKHFTKHVVSTTLLFFLMCSGLFAQTNVPVVRERQSYYYVEVSESMLKAAGFSLKKTVSVNWGKEAPAATSYKLSDEKETGLINFENVFGALNYLGAQGWEVVAVYVRNSGLSYLLRMDASKHTPTALTRAIDELLDSLTLQSIEK